VDDPLLRAAVLDLFQANQALTDAYREYSSTHADRQLRAIADAEKRIDMARERVWTVQSLHTLPDE
jgi:hypothetical protein